MELVHELFNEEVVAQSLSIDLQNKGLYLPSIFQWTNGNIKLCKDEYSSFPAWTANELIKLLPVGLKIKIEGMRKCYDGTLQIRFSPILRDKMIGSTWTLDYDRFQSDYYVEATTFPDAVALMLIKLIDKGLLIYPTLCSTKKQSAVKDLIKLERLS